MKKSRKKHIVCLGGGIGTVNLITGLREYNHTISVIVSMADDGGSGGRLRKLFHMPPPGDSVNCLSALSRADTMLRLLLTYRFPGDRWGRKESLGGHKLGNFILTALTQIYHGDYDKALQEMSRLFACRGTIIRATEVNVSLLAKTIEGKRVVGEEKIDLGKYDGVRELSKVFLVPKNAQATKAGKRALDEADSIVAGPGDLYTTILPVLLVKDIQKRLIETKAKRIFIVNVANKPFETPNYTVAHYIDAVQRHLGVFPFDYVVVNTNMSLEIPRKLRYQYVQIDDTLQQKMKSILIKGDMVYRLFPLYHDPHRLARELLPLF